jgi:hypothetical protein
MTLCARGFDTCIWGIKNELSQDISVSLTFVPPFRIAFIRNLLKVRRLAKALPFELSGKRSTPGQNGRDAEEGSKPERAPEIFGQGVTLMRTLLLVAL